MARKNWGWVGLGLEAMFHWNTRKTDVAGDGGTPPKPLPPHGAECHIVSAINFSVKLDYPIMEQINILLFPCVQMTIRLLLVDWKTFVYGILYKRGSNSWSNFLKAGSFNYTVSGQPHRLVHINVSKTRNFHEKLMYAHLCFGFLRVFTSKDLITGGRIGDVSKLGGCMVV